MKTIYCDENNNAINIEKPILEICNRHILAFGENIQNRISNLTVGVISVGGLGMILIEQLMRLFPKKLIFIDRDNVEISNLNRLVGANKNDAKARLNKVDLPEGLFWTSTLTKKLYRSTGTSSTNRIKIYLENVILLWAPLIRMLSELPQIVYALHME